MAQIRLVLVRDGRPACSIVIAREATKAAQFAAYELQWHFQQITGAEVPIVRDGQPVKGTRVLVGASTATAALGLKNDSFKPQEYLIRFLPGTLILMGRDREDRQAVQYDPLPSPEAMATWPSIWDEQGTMYAVYDFLERYCNVRWFNPTESGMDIPPTKTLAISGTEVRRAPWFKYRWACYHSSENYDAYTALWPGNSEGFKTWEAAAFPELHRRFPDGWLYTHAKRGFVQLFRYRMREGGELAPGNHSLYGYYDRFWEKASDPERAKLFVGYKPDWFAQGYIGRPPQMCYSSRGLIEQVVQDARDFFDGKGAKPGAVAAGNYFCVEPMDNSQFCRCPQCQAWLQDQDEYDPFFSNGRHSDYFFNFVNEVAREVRKTHPDKWIVTLAYHTHAAHPKRIKLEPNILVQFCFACNRLNFDRASYEHEIKLLREWAAKRRGRPLYLWLYYTFPVEIANNGQFHCFPGFFAHAIGEQFKLFRQLGVTGAFHCGYGQEVEAYLTYKLMDDPGLEVEKLLDEYFKRLYGSAAEPMKQLYFAIERTYSNPANYPEPVARGIREGHHHQTEEVAWGYLGTERRMASFARLLQQAKASVKTAVEKKRLELFEKGVWDYMVAGRRAYLEKIKAKYGPVAPPLMVPYTVRGPLKGDPKKLDCDEAAALVDWRSRLGEPTKRKIEGRALNDGESLYLRLEERIAPQSLRRSRDLFAGDYWQIFLAAQRGRPFWEIAVGADGRLVCREFGRGPEGTPAAWDSGATVQVDVSRADRWLVSLALPLVKLFPNGAKPAAKLYMNIVRRSAGSDDQPMWVPSFGDLNDPTRWRELNLETADSLPAETEMQALRAQDLVAHWPLNEGYGNTVGDVSGNKLKGTLIHGASWVKDKARFVVRLQDRHGQYIDLGNPPEVQLTGPLTLEGWFKYEPSEVAYPALFGKGYEQTGAYSLHLRPGLTVWFEIDGEDGSRNIHNPTNRALIPGSWCHIVATYDGEVMRVYINGREAGNGQPVQTTLRKTAEPLRIGWLGSYGFFNGYVRDVAIYRRAMERGEVFARYVKGLLR